MKPKFITVKSPQLIAVDTQTIAVQFCFAKQIAPNLYTNLSYWSECRDFLGDVIYANEIQKPISIWGFQYDPTLNPLNPDQLILGIQFTSKEQEKTFQNNLTIYGKEIFESWMGIPIPEYTRVFRNLTKGLLFVDPIIQKTTLGISLFTFYLKCLCYKLDTTKDIFDAMKESWKTTKEGRYIIPMNIDISKNIKKLTKNIKSIAQTQPTSHGYDSNTTDLDTYKVHNATGFFSICRWKSPDLYASKFL